MTNHPAALRALADRAEIFGCVSATKTPTADARFVEIAREARAIATDLEKAQAEPVAWMKSSDDVAPMMRMLNAVRVPTIWDVPLYRAQPPAIPISPPQEWVDFLLDDSSDKGNCSLAEFRAFANLAWGKMRSVLAATEPKAGVADGFVSVGYQFLFASPFTGDPVWRDSSNAWNGQSPKASREIFILAAPNQETEK